MTEPTFRFQHRLRVRWAEIDAQKIVFNAHYLMYADTAIAAYWRALALPYEACMALLEGDLYVKKATLEYHASARMDELIDVGLRCARIGTSSIDFAVQIARGGQVLVTGELLYVFANPSTQRSKPVPDALRAVLLGYEAGGAPWQVQVGGWDAVGRTGQPLRRAVFTSELGVPTAAEADGRDAGALHAVLTNGLGMAVATGRLLQPAPGVAQVGRLAVHPVLRASGFGRAVLDTLVQAAQERGDREVLLQAEAHACGFYARAGFAPRGAPFEEAGITHQEMVRGLG
jgi:YbgC/YbaW family acyl-CoA thioester hydrolase